MTALNLFSNSIPVIALLSVAAVVLQYWDVLSPVGPPPQLGPHPPEPATFVLTALGVVGVLICSLVVLCNCSESDFGGSSFFSGLGAAWSAAPPEPGAVGLHNLGNTCYVNSTLVAIAQVAPLTSYFLSDEFSHHINTRNASGSQGQVAHAYARMMNSLWRGGRAAVSAADFHAAVARREPRFCGFEQQDASEFLNAFLDALAEDMNQGTALPRSESGRTYRMTSTRDTPALLAQNAGGDGGPPVELVLPPPAASTSTLAPVTLQTVATESADEAALAHAAWRLHVTRNRSIVADLFQGQQLNRTACITPGCGYVSRSFEPFMLLALPIPDVKRVWRVRLVASCLVYPLRTPASSAEEVASAVELQRALGALPLVSCVELHLPQSALCQDLRGALSQRISEFLQQSRVGVCKGLDKSPLPFDLVLCETSSTGILKCILQDRQSTRRIRDCDVIAYAFVPHKTPDAVKLFLPVYQRRRKWTIETGPDLMRHPRTRRAHSDVASLGGPTIAAAEAARVCTAPTPPAAPGALPLHFHPVYGDADTALHFRTVPPDYFRSVEVVPSAIPLLLRIEDGDLLGNVRTAALLWARLHWEQRVEASEKVSETTASAGVGAGKADTSSAPLPFGGSDGYLPALSWVTNFADSSQQTCGFCSRNGCSGCPMATAATAVLAQSNTVTSGDGVTTESKRGTTPATTAAPQSVKPALWPIGLAVAEMDACATALLGHVKGGSSAAVSRRQARERLAASASARGFVGSEAAWDVPYDTLPSLPALSIDWFSELDFPSCADHLMLKPLWAAYKHLSGLRNTLVPSASQLLRQSMPAPVDALDCSHPNLTETRSPVTSLPDPLSVMPTTLQPWQVAGMTFSLPMSELLHSPRLKNGSGGTISEDATEETALQSERRLPHWAAVTHPPAGFATEPVTLAQCLDLYAHTDTPLSADNLWRCERCKLSVQAIQGVSLVRPPEVLTVVLKRFVQINDYGDSHKVDTCVLFGLELDMDPWIMQPVAGSGTRGNFLYDLFAVVQHAGVLSAGHYTTHARHPISGRWYCYNDAVVRPTIPDVPGGSEFSATAIGGISRGTEQRAALERVLVTPEAYILLYRRRHSESALPLKPVSSSPGPESANVHDAAPGVRRSFEVETAELTRLLAPPAAHR